MTPLERVVKVKVSSKNDIIRVLLGEEELQEGEGGVSVRGLSSVAVRGGVVDVIDLYSLWLLLRGCNVDG